MLRSSAAREVRRRDEDGLVVRHHRIGVKNTSRGIEVDRARIVDLLQLDP
jgi:hypothetical protein